MTAAAPAPEDAHRLLDPESARVARSSALSDDVVDDVVETFKVLANGTRIRLLRALVEGELCVGDLAAIVDLSISAVSHQLRVLRRAGIVGSRSEGKRVYYSLRDSFAARLLTDCIADRL